MKDNPFDILRPDQRWTPNKEHFDQVKNRYDKLLPPLVHKVRVAVEQWRDKNYAGATATSKALLKFWFDKEHLNHKNEKFRFYFAQRESIESIIYLFEVAKARDKYEMLKFDITGQVQTGNFYENWARYVVKMATGTGKTKVLALVLVWSYFNAKYEKESGLSKNFLLIAPNIIVLNRILKDFDGLKIFKEEPFIPENGWEDKNWKNDFQITLHIQDELKAISENGNIFLTNTHRVSFTENSEPTKEEMFLGFKPKPDADTNKMLDLGKLLRSNKINDLVVLNDEAHHIHDKSLAWFKNIEDISNKLYLKTGKHISLQCDVSATPKHNDASIFVQTIADYPLVEAIKHNVVKSPVLPDKESREKIQYKESSDVIDMYKDYINLGYYEWKKQFEEIGKFKTPLLFVMAMTTKDADKIADFLEANYEEFKNKVLTIHTTNNGDLAENSKTAKVKEELEKLRKAADSVDSDESPYRAICSVLMLREGWDVKNVTTIVGLRKYGTESKILPEQAIGRGLRKMFSLDTPETLSVVGTPKFIEFVEELKYQGVSIQYKPMDIGPKEAEFITIEIDKSNPKKNIDALDIEFPILSPRVTREYKNVLDIDISQFEFNPVELKLSDPNAEIDIVFNDIEDNFSHSTKLTEASIDSRNILSFITQQIAKQTKLLYAFHHLYEKVQDFVVNYLFGKVVDLNDRQVASNLGEPEAKKTIYDLFNNAILNLTVSKSENTKILKFRKLTDAKSRRVKAENYVVPKKSVFTYIVGDNNFEREFAGACDNRYQDVIAFAKNDRGDDNINFFIEYQKEDGTIANYFPDFLVKLADNDIYIVETKGREDLDDIRKIKRLAQWCKDVNALMVNRKFTPVYLKEDVWDKYKTNIKSFREIVNIAEYKNEK